MHAWMIDGHIMFKTEMISKTFFMNNCLKH